MRPEEELGELRDRFERFVAETREQSPLYARFSRACADDVVALEVLAAAPDPRQRRPNLLFAAIHDLLLAGYDHRLARYYPSLGGDLPPDGGADEALQDLVRSARDELLSRVRTRATQTNEVARCGALWPALRQVAARFDGPLTLIELGSSAGLLLHLDRYRYDLGGATSGRSTSPVGIAPKLVAARPPAGHDPMITQRVGVDLSPLDPRDADDARWLQACVWPEHIQRLELLRGALQVARRHHDVEVVVGDIVEILPEVLADAAPDSVPVVMHSAAVAYVEAAGRAAVARVIEDVGERRDLAWLSLEGPFLEPFASLSEAAGPAPEDVAFCLGLTVFTEGRRDDSLLARAHPHGRWLEWLDRPSQEG